MLLSNMSHIYSMNNEGLIIQVSEALLSISERGLLCTFRKQRALKCVARRASCQTRSTSVYLVCLVAAPAILLPLMHGTHVCDGECTSFISKYFVTIDQLLHLYKLKTCLIIGLPGGNNCSRLYSAPGKFVHFPVPHWRATHCCCTVGLVPEVTLFNNNNMATKSLKKSLRATFYERLW